jgi:hypothetical protein
MAQDIVKPPIDSVILEEYCSLVTRGKLFSNEVTIAIDFGDNPNNRRRLRDRKGEVVDFTSTIDALNYLGEQGWKLVNAFPINATANSNPQYNYVFKREYLGKKPKGM